MISFGCRERMAISKACICHRILIGKLAYLSSGDLSEARLCTFRANLSMFPSILGDLAYLLC